MNFLIPDKMTDNEIIKALECCIKDQHEGCCKLGSWSEQWNCMADLMKDALDLINRQRSEIEALIAGQETLQKYIAEQKAEIERLTKRRKEEVEKLMSATDKVITEAKAEARKEFAEKTNELLKRYSHLHKRADEVRRSTEEYADGTPMEMVSVWEALSLKKWEMTDYENMNALQDNIETIAIERLLTEIEKDFKLLVKEMVGDDG